MRVQVFISGLLINPGRDVLADILVIKLILVFSRFVDIVSRTNTIMEYFFNLLSGASAVNKKYFVSIVIALLI